MHLFIRLGIYSVLFINSRCSLPVASSTSSESIAIVRERTTAHSLRTAHSIAILYCVHLPYNVHHSDWDLFGMAWAHIRHTIEIGK